MKKKKLQEYFNDMVSPFGTDKALSNAESNQFGDFKGIETRTDYDSEGDHPGIRKRKEVKKKNKNINADYYKEVIKKIKDFQKADTEKSESEMKEELKEFKAPKRNVEDVEEPMGYKAPTGTGMEGIKYDNDDTEAFEDFLRRLDGINSDDPTWEKMKDAGERYKKYKYGEKLDEPEDEDYQQPRPVRAITDKSDIKKEQHMKYDGVNDKNIFKANGKLMSEEHVLSLVDKLPERVKVDESVFVITDGDNFYKMLWEGDEAVITNFKNLEQVNEDINKMKGLYSFKSSDTTSTKKNITEDTNDMFKKMMDTVRNSKGLIGDEK